jgi:hypothetical protein
VTLYSLERFGGTCLFHLQDIYIRVTVSSLIIAKASVPKGSDSFGLFSDAYQISRLGLHAVEYYNEYNWWIGKQMEEK